MKRFLSSLALTGVMVAAYALAEVPAPSCAEMADRSQSVSEAVAMGIPRQTMMASATSPEDARLINRIYDESWPVYSARAMAETLCQRAAAE